MPLEDPTEFDDSLRTLVDKVTQSALLLVLVKLTSAWTVAAFTSVELRSRLVWGFLPYAGLQTTPENVRLIAWCSTLVAAAVAIVWTGVHFALRHRWTNLLAWGAAAALPMAGNLTLLEWTRTIDGAHFIPTVWMVRILLALGAAAVLFVGFIELPKRQRGATRRHGSSPTPTRPATAAAHH